VIFWVVTRTPWVKVDALYKAGNPPTPAAIKTKIATRTEKKRLALWHVEETLEKESNFAKKSLSQKKW
jgi:hypothetical protein